MSITATELKIILENIYYYLQKKIFLLQRMEK